MSKKLKIILGGIIFIAGFLVIRVGAVLTDKVKNSNVPANISETFKNGDFTASDPMKKDDDKDGVSDRDEIIYGSDPFNPDTDGDGYKDGEEIASSYDPLDSSDNRKANPSGSKSLSLISPTANLTDRVLNMGIASLIDDNGNLNSDMMTEQKFADLLTSVNNEAIMHLSASPIADSDIKIIDDNSKEAVSKYINSVSVIIEEGIFSPAGTMLMGSAEDIVGLSTEKNYYANKYNALKAIEVPSSWKEIHKSTLLNLQVLKNTTESLTSKAIDSDPIKASFALNQLQSAFLSLNSLLSEVSRLAKSQGVPLRDSIFDILQIANSTPTLTPTPTP